MRYVLTALSIGASIWFLRWCLSYRDHVPHPELRERWAKLPDPKR